MLPNTKTTTEINDVLSAFHFIHKSSSCWTILSVWKCGGWLEIVFFLTDTEGVAKTHDWEWDCFDCFCSHTLIQASLAACRFYYLFINANSLFGVQGRGWWKDINWWDAGGEVTCICTECRPRGSGKGKLQKMKRIICIFAVFSNEAKLG